MDSHRRKLRKQRSKFRSGSVRAVNGRSTLCPFALQLRCSAGSIGCACVYRFSLMQLMADYQWFANLMDTQARCVLSAQPSSPGENLTQVGVVGLDTAIAGLFSKYCREDHKVPCVAEQLGGWVGKGDHDSGRVLWRAMLFQREGERNQTNQRNNKQAKQGNSYEDSA